MRLVFGQAIANRQRRPDCALRIVLMCHRSPEDRHHRVADELLDRAAEALEIRADARVIRRQQGPHVLRVELLRAGREADEIAEEDGDNLALLARSSL